MRLYQTRGLLPPPRREGRVAYYGDDHRRRLRLITQLQERGFSLASIKHLIDGMPAERIPELSRPLEQLGPLAESVVTVALRRSLRQAAEAFLAEQAERLDIDIPRPGG